MPEEQGRRPIDGLAGPDLYSLFRSKVKPRLHEINTARKGALAKRKQRWLIASAPAVTVIGAVVLATIYLQWPWVAPFIVAIAAGVLGFAWADAPIKAYESELKAWVLELIGDTLENVTYDRGAGAFSLADFDNVHLLASYNRKQVEDHFQGRYRGCSFQIAHAHLRYRSSGKNSSTKTVFKGLLLEISVPRATSGRIIIVRDWGRIGNALSGLFKPGQRVKIPDAVFESKFEVYAEHEAEALQFVTRSFVENFAKLSDTTGSDDIVAAFDGPRFLLAVNKVPGFLHDLTVHTPAEQLSDVLEAVAGRVSVIFHIIDRLHGEG